MPTHLATESTLLNEARNGNPDAFGLLVDHYRQNLYRLTLRITGNPEDAEDALQDALMNAYCNLQRFRGNSRFYTWMSRITLNQALMSLRRRRRTRQVTFSSLESTQLEGTSAKLDIEDGGLSPEDLFANGELQQRAQPRPAPPGAPAQQCVYPAECVRLFRHGTHTNAWPVGAGRQVKAVESPDPAAQAAKQGLDSLRYAGSQAGGPIWPERPNLQRVPLDKRIAPPTQAPAGRSGAVGSRPGP